MLLIKFHAGGKFFVPSRILKLLELRFKTFSQTKIPKIPEILKITMTVRTTGYFASLGTFGNISGSFLMQNRPNIGVYTVRNISKIFALALQKRKIQPTYKQPKVTDNQIFKLNNKNTKFYINFVQIQH